MDQEKERLVLENLGLVEVIMRRTPCTLRLQGQDWEDAYQAGRVGLVQAAERYDPAIASFTTFAWRRVRGALLDWARGAHPMYRAYRSDTHGQTPLAVVSLEARALAMKPGAEELTIEGSLATTHNVERDAVVRDAVNNLPERQRWVVEAKMSGYTGPEIGEALGCGEANVSLIWHQALDRLREALA